MARMETSPWEFDSSDSNILFRGDRQLDGPFKVASVRWTGYQSADDYVILRDRSDKIVWEARAQDVLDEINFCVDDWWWGIKPDISGGKVYLYIA